MDWQLSQNGIGDMTGSILNLGSCVSYLSLVSFWISSGQFHWLLARRFPWFANEEPVPRFLCILGIASQAGGIIILLSFDVVLFK